MTYKLSKKVGTIFGTFLDFNLSRADEYGHYVDLTLLRKKALLMNL